jgi:hypothetical protein
MIAMASTQELSVREKTFIEMLKASGSVGAQVTMLAAEAAWE